MRRISFLLAICSLATAAFSQRQLPPPQRIPAKVHGQLRLPDGRPAPEGVFLFLNFDTGEIAAQTRTDSAGRFDFPSLNQGLYLLHVRQPGFQEITQDVDLRTNQMAFLNLELHPIAKPDAGALPPEGPEAAISAKLPANDKARREFLKAQQLLADSKHSNSSIPHLQKVAKIEPSFQPTYVLLGKAYMDENDWKDAESTLRKGADLDPKDFSATFMLGACLNQEKDFAAAEKTLLRSLEINPQAVEAHYEIARTYFSLNDWQKAEPHVIQAVKLDPEFAPAHVAMGNIFLRKGNAAAAQTEYEQYLKLAPDGIFAPGVKTALAKINH